MSAEEFVRALDELRAELGVNHWAAVTLGRYRFALEYIATHDNRITKNETGEAASRRAQTTAARALYGRTDGH